ncbi:MAG: class I SAM-dependent methyltransferase [Pseudomonadota bacterium]
MADETVEGAYRLKTPEDSVELYRSWADTYDADFAESHGYIIPAQVAEALLAEAPSPWPVLDVGAGTGLVGAELAARSDGAVDAVDISPEMLAIAEAKGLYRERIVADLTQRLDLPDATYGGVVSAGTFTHGHVGPVCLPELLRVARPGAVFCLSINAQAFDQAGFGSAFAKLVAAGEISPLSFRDVPMYVPNATHAHAADRGLIAIFQKA